MVKYTLKANRRGSLVGEREDGVKRIAAFTYEVPSETKEGTSYKVYIEDLDNAEGHTYRCTCEKFFFNGECKHGKPAIDFQEYLEENEWATTDEEYERRTEAREKMKEGK